MHEIDNTLFSFIVIAVTLFLALCVAILVIMDHKAKIPGDPQGHPFSISGTRLEHPYLAFVTTAMLASVMLPLLFELSVTLLSSFGLFQEEQRSSLLKNLHEQRVTERLRHFHNNPVADYPNLGLKNVCFYCHGDFPHSKEPMIRTLLNMHTQFLGCLTCHVDPRKVPESNLSFAWLNFSGIDVSGPQFGTSIQPDTGDLVDTDDYYSKIVVSATSGPDEGLLETPETDPQAVEFIKIRDTLSDEDREALKKKFHRLVSPKGRFCSRCHTDENNSFIPFRSLGFSDQRVTDVTNLNIIGITQKYRTFYMPDLFSPDSSLPDVNMLLGPERPTNSQDDSAGEDPRTWWRRTFDQVEAPRKAPQQ